MKSKGREDFFWPKIVELYQQAFSVLIKDPTIWVLFLVMGILDFIALTLLFLAPSPPVSYLLAPVIKTFWSPRFLHYPENFLLLPKLHTHAHLFIATVFGVFISGMVIKKVESWMKKGERLKTFEAARSVAERYVSLVFAWLAAYFIFKGLFRMLNPFLRTSLWMQLGVGFIAAVLVQALLGFVVPAVLLRDGNLFKGFWNGVAFGFRNLAAASVLVLVPILIVTLVSFGKGLAPILIDMTPESVLWVLIFGIIFTVIADIWVTLVTTVLYLRKAGIFSHENT
ncbi:MAG: hypothetical protein HY587_00190 [Candidatus Omnitrophica bacterium]|nr:hypothetical protein [Candidatus Omnitrophota bacterium]